MKRIMMISVILAFLVSLTSCGTKYYSFVVMAGSDNGFTAASRSYIGIDGTHVSKITKRQYEKLTLGNMPYASAGQKTYTFDATAPDSDPANWTIVENQYDTDVYDIQALTDDLKAMGVSYTGDVYICLTTFGNYRIIHVANLVNNAVTGETTSMFMDNVMLTIPQGVELYEIREVKVRI